jgi:O-methyltransferase
MLSPEELYLDLLKKCLTRALFPESYRPALPAKGLLRTAFYAPVRKLLAVRGLTLGRLERFDDEARSVGADWPIEAETMIGLRRLDNLQECITDVLRRGVPGDLIETGVWRGGATILMRAVLQAYGDQDRHVWVADSFQGLPRPDAQYPLDAGSELWKQRRLAISLAEVKANFARYGLLDARVHFLVGWFHDTLPSAPMERLAILRLDGDLYGSTIDALEHLYPKLEVGGYAIIDDYWNERLACRQAVDDFRAHHGIDEPLQRIDWTGTFWLRQHR